MDRSHHATHRRIDRRNPAARRHDSWNQPIEANPFHYVVEENGKKIEHDFSPRVCENARKLGLDAIIAIGGDGTLTIARDLARMGIPFVGVPKTIDNDLSATEVSFWIRYGAATSPPDAIDRLHTTAGIARPRHGH